ncbi:MAG: protease Do, partial [Verrucomicrobiaceae bacterium]|nr:protease Do [Verrucomicrobiaceae bacterium]
HNINRSPSNLMNTSSSTSSLWHRAGMIAGVTVLSGTLLAFTPALKDKNPPLKLSVTETPAVENAKMFPSLSPVIKKVAPSVVKISVSSQAKASPAGMPEGMPDLRQFFGGGNGGFDLRGGQRQLRMPKQQGVGSGVIVTSDGYVLTNNHVVENADEIKVSLNDGRDFTGKVIGRDPKTDVAVIKIEGTGLPAVTFADSDKIEVGDMVLAIGNPFGIGQTVTTGIVSAKGRATMGLDYEDFIQTDAAINPGNSGGALVDIDGRLVGMNTAILSRSGGNQGIGFAVPTNLARWVMESLVSSGHVERGFLGVNIQDLTPELAKEFKLEQAKGALVAEVTPGSPAEKAGVKSGDLITAFNGKDVADSRHLKLQVGATLPNSSVPVKLLRNGTTTTLTVKVEALPGDKLADNSSTDSNAEDSLHGVAVADLDSATREQLKVPAKINGAVVTQVEEDSAAYEAGIREGDVITEINHVAIKNAEQAVAECAKPSSKRTLVKVWSHGSSRYVVVDQSKVG